MTIRHRISAQTDTEPGDDWRERAACKDSLTPDDWFPGKGGLTGPNLHALFACRFCPVASACLQYALDAHPIDGLWGGTTLDQRAVMTGDAHDAATGRVGSASAYKRGCRCFRCRAYNASVTREWKERQEATA